jgi:hypothetical protein
MRWSVTSVILKMANGAVPHSWPPVCSCATSRMLPGAEAIRNAVTSTAHRSRVLAKTLVTDEKSLLLNETCPRLSWAADSVAPPLNTSSTDGPANAPT